jgi:hypothetical protein
MPPFQPRLILSCLLSGKRQPRAEAGKLYIDFPSYFPPLYRPFTSIIAFSCQNERYSDTSSSPVTNIDGEETPSVNNYLLLDGIQGLGRDKLIHLRWNTPLSFFRSATPALPLSDTNFIPVISGEQNIPMKPLPTHQQIRRRLTRGRTRCLTAERASDQVTEGNHRHQSISPWTRELTDIRDISHINRKGEIQEVLCPLLADGTNSSALLERQGPLPYYSNRYP